MHQKNKTVTAIVFNILGLNSIYKNINAKLTLISGNNQNIFTYFLGKKWKSKKFSTDIGESSIFDFEW